MARQPFPLQRDPPDRILQKTQIAEALEILRTIRSIMVFWTTVSLIAGALYLIALYERI